MTRGVKTADETIRRELLNAGISVTPESSIGEVPYSIIGKTPHFEFRRAWYYWVVTGVVPLEDAIEMYKDPRGRHDVRVSGHCGAPHPTKWAFPIPIPEEYRGLSYGDLSKALNIGGIPGLIHVPRFCSGYHIDTQEGLNFFVATMKKYNIL